MLKKQDLCMAIVEKSAYFGKTANKLNRWWNKNHCDIVGHNQLQADVLVNKACRQINEAKEERVKELMKLRVSELREMLQMMSKARLQRRYGSPQIDAKRDLPPTELEVERELKVSRKEIDKWVKQNKKKFKPFLVRKKLAEPEKPKKLVRRRKVTTSAYVQMIKSWNKSMNGASTMHGISG